MPTIGWCILFLLNESSWTLGINRIIIVSCASLTPNGVRLARGTLISKM